MRGSSATFFTRIEKVNAGVNRIDTVMGAVSCATGVSVLMCACVRGENNKAARCWASCAGTLFRVCACESRARSVELVRLGFCAGLVGSAGAAQLAEQEKERKETRKDRSVSPDLGEIGSIWVYN